MTTTTDRDLFDPDTDALSLNPYYGYVLLQPWADEQQHEHVQTLAGKYGLGEQISPPLQRDDGSIVYFYTPNRNYWREAAA